jgi:hypothetical protein
MTSVHGPWWTGLHTSSGDLIWVTHLGFDGLEQMGMRQRRLKVVRQQSHWRVTGMALRCAKARREEPRRGRGDGEAGGDVGEALEGRR